MVTVALLPRVIQLSAHQRAKLPMLAPFLPWFLLIDINKCMNYQDQQQTQQTDQWLQRHGVKVAHIYVGTAELFQATKLATTTLKYHGRLLAHNQAHTLNNFLQATRHHRQRQKITQAHCLRVMNIAKQAQRLAAKQRKAF